MPDRYLFVLGCIGALAQGLSIMVQAVWPLYGFYAALAALIFLSWRLTMIPWWHTQVMQLAQTPYASHIDQDLLQQSKHVLSKPDVLAWFDPRENPTMTTTLHAIFGVLLLWGSGYGILSVVLLGWWMMLDRRRTQTQSSLEQLWPKLS